MSRKVLVLGSITVAAAVVGLLLAGGVFTRGEAQALPAPARVLQVIGLTKQQAVRLVAAARLRPVVQYARLPSAHGRVIGMTMGSLLNAKGHTLPPISLEGSGVGIIVAR